MALLSIIKHALMISEICFVEDPVAMLVEARWVLKPGAPLNQIVLMESFREGSGNGGFVVVSPTKLYEKATIKSR
jgi:hypothetical protein